MTFTLPFKRAILLSLALFVPAGLFAQAAASNVETQLREALRATTLQLRTAQGELGAAQGERDQAKADLAALQKRLEALEKQAAADRSSAQASIAALNAKIAEKDGENARLAEKLEATLAALDQSRRLAEERATALAASKTSNAELVHTNSLLRADNRELFSIGTEILSRYEDFGLGRSLAAREPFTKLTRVRMQNIVQGYEDSLEQHRAKLPAEPAPAAPAPAAH